MGSADYGFFKNTPDFSGVFSLQLVLSDLKVLPFLNQSPTQNK